MDKILQNLFPLLKLVVKAISKGAGEDLKVNLCSMNNTTNNAAAFLRSDLINTNLERNVVFGDDTLELLKFNRAGWKGTLLIDRVNKLTFSILTDQTLTKIITKNRHVPHYLQTILHVQNRGVVANGKQLYLFEDMPASQFSDDEYLREYHKIMGEEILPEDGYKHFVIVYSTSHFEVTSIKLLMLDENLLTVFEYGLEEMLVPNFEDLTYEDSHITVVKDARSLVSIKPGITVDTEIERKTEKVVISKIKDGEMHA